MKASMRDSRIRRQWPLHAALWSAGMAEHVLKPVNPSGHAYRSNQSACQRPNYPHSELTNSISFILPPSGDLYQVLDVSSYKDEGEARRPI